MSQTIKLEYRPCWDPESGCPTNERWACRLLQRFVFLLFCAAAFAVAVVGHSWGAVVATVATVATAAAAMTAVATMGEIASRLRRIGGKIV